MTIKKLSVKEQTKRIQQILAASHECLSPLCGKQYVPMMIGLGVEDVCPHCQKETLDEIKDYLAEANPQIFSKISQEEEAYSSRGRRSKGLEKNIRTANTVIADASKIAEIIENTSVSLSNPSTG